MLRVPIDETIRPIICKTKVYGDTDEQFKMKAVQWMGPTKVVVNEVPKPKTTDPTDAVVRITTSTICGSDLHLYHGSVQGMEKGDILGHEFMGIVEQVGSEVKDFKPGDRVVVSAVIACGTCWYCKRQEFSFCEYTNPSKEMEELYGHRIAGVFGYSHLTGGYPGGQAEYTRVPFADVNLLKVPSHLPDEKVLFLSDIACTSYHATQLGKVKEGDVVAVWGCGPVGLLTLAWAKFKKASKIIAIDGIESRLRLAQEKLGADIINFNEQDVVQTIRKLVPERGPDVVIECAGFRFPKSFTHRVQSALNLENDAMDILTEMVISCRKGGHLSLVGDYFLYGNSFPIGPLMEKGVIMRGSQVFVQRYWKDILNLIETGQFDPTFIITHHFRLDEAAEAYRVFDKKEDDAIKVLLHVQPPSQAGPSTEPATGV